MIQVASHVAQAVATGRAVVALESTVLTHGLPRPRNLALALDLERVVAEAGAVPATVGIIDGRLVVGLDGGQLERLARERTDKASAWNLAAILARGASAGTTVAATLHAAAAAGIEVFATGGIGGVHHEPFDESADLMALARYPVLTVCAGPKSVLDVPATLERLETLGVPVLGWRDHRLAGFHSPHTDLALAARVESAAQVAATFRIHRRLGLPGGIVVSQGVESGLAATDVHAWVTAARGELEAAGVRGKGVTPALLQAIAERSAGATVEVNLRLLAANARLAGEIAIALSAAPAVERVGRAAALAPTEAP